MTNRARWCAVVAAAGFAVAPLAGQGSAGALSPHTSVTNDMLVQAQQSGDWLMYGGNYWNNRYSPLTTLNTVNVKNLVPRMVFQTGTPELASLETTPVVVNGVLYVTSAVAPNNTVIAYSLRTGKLLWRMEHKTDAKSFAVACCGRNNRGVAVANGMVYTGTLDGMLIAYDQQTGAEKWTVQVGDPGNGYTETMAPLAVGDKVIIGTSGGEYGIRGFLKAFNATTGALVWTWYTIPSPQDGGWWGSWAKTTPDGADLHRDVAAEKADSAKYADSWQYGGGGIWMTPAYDPETQTLYAAIGNPSPDLDGGIRPGDNRWTDGIVAIDAATGRFKWGYQTVPHDVWDLDAVSPPVIAMVGGKKVVVHAGKTGWVYVLDAATGALVRRSDAFVPQENMFALPTAAGTRMLPGANGGSEWSPIAVNPTLAYAYVVGLHQPMNYITKPAPYSPPKLWLGSQFVGIAGEAQWGNVSAVNLATGKIAWQIKTEQPMIGGATATAGGLVFTGEGNGWFKAYDAKSGAVLWQFQCGAGVNAAPSVFSMDGEEFVAVAAGGNFQLRYPLGDAIFIFGLPKAGK
jgi:alcohol dehydrogenase (cytochrome c)